MYKIAICDDIHSELEKIEEMLALFSNERSVEFELETFEDAAVLLDHIFAEKFIPDLIITDIYMKEISGVDAVTKLRTHGYDIPVIFLTMTPEYALTAYGLDVLQYLMKPLDKEKLFHALDVSFMHMEKQEETKIVLKTTDGVCSVDKDDIIYCETTKNYQALLLKEGEQKIRMTSVELYDLLKKFPQFMKCGRSYILNMNHIAKVSREEVYMDNGDKIYIPKSKAIEFTNAYFEYFCNIS